MLRWLLKVGDVVVRHKTKTFWKYEVFLLLSGFIRNHLTLEICLKIICFWRRFRRLFEFPATQYFVNSQLKTFESSVFFCKAKRKVKFRHRVKQNEEKKFRFLKNSSLFKCKYLFDFLTVIVTPGTVIGCSAKTKFCQMAPKSTENH